MFTDACSYYTNTRRVQNFAVRERRSPSSLSSSTPRCSCKSNEGGIFLAHFVAAFGDAETTARILLRRPRSSSHRGRRRRYINWELRRRTCPANRLRRGRAPLLRRAASEAAVAGAVPTAAEREERRPPPPKQSAIARSTRRVATEKTRCELYKDDFCCLLEKLEEELIGVARCLRRPPT